VQSGGLPGFNYHFVQGFGWGLGFALAGTTVALIVYVLAAVVFRLSVYQ
jgi:hypothetical protein